MNRRVLFFGDSHIAGVGDPSGLGWVGRVACESFRVGLPLTAYNLGVRGETSEQVAARWRVEAQPRLLAGVESRLVFSFGANDTTIEQWRLRTPEQRSCDALDAVLAQASRQALPVLVVGPAPVADAAQNERIASLSSAFAELCARRGIRFVSVVEALLASQTWISEVAADDGAHPGAEGYRVLSELVIGDGWADWLRRSVS